MEVITFNGDDKVWGWPHLLRCDHTYILKNITKAILKKQIFQGNGYRKNITVKKKRTKTISWERDKEAVCIYIKSIKMKRKPLCILIYIYIYIYKSLVNVVRNATNRERLCKPLMHPYPHSCHIRWCHI